MRSISLTSPGRRVRIARAWFRPHRAAGGMKLAVSGAMLTDTGLVRDHNEDSVAFMLPTATEPGLALVADGMGGHAAGEVASGIAARVVATTFLSAPGPVPRRLRAALDSAHAEIRAHAAAAPETAGMGTTCTAIAFADDGAWLAHIGDSRAYLVRGGAIRQISTDHSLVARLVADGAMTPEEAAASPDKNVILQALGTNETIEPQISPAGLPLAAGDVLLLCSDGLSDLVPEAALRDAAPDAPEAACRRLIAAALDAGGHDNVSVGVFHVGDPGQATAAPRDTREVAVPDGVR